MMPMHDLESVLADPHLVATGFFATGEHPSEGTIRSMRAPMTWSDTVPEPMRHAPRLGEHTVEVLEQAGFGAEEIDALIAQGAVQAGAAPSSAEQER
jgi:crotonobetainyl-CoA:carnitine CoA-transferase CaiB-like acyl-CoA transferase